MAVFVKAGRFGRNGEVRAVQVRNRFQVNDGRVLVQAAVDGYDLICSRKRE